MISLISGSILGTVLLILLAVKWELDKKTAIPAAIMIGLISVSAASIPVSYYDVTFFHAFIFEISLVAAMASALLLFRFYRDPERPLPAEKDIIVSPADGRIIYIKKIEKGAIPISEKKGRICYLNDFVKTSILPAGGYLIGISMNYLDVHVNRAPVSGRISLLKHIKGKFLSLKHKEAVFQNERILTVIDNGLFKVGIVQIASRLVRRIVPYLRQNDEVRQGERMGAIRFGSQVDLVLPDLPYLSIKVKPGEKVTAGTFVLARFEGSEYP